MTNVLSIFVKCVCQILVLLCTCFAMSTKMAANCKPRIAKVETCSLRPRGQNDCNRKRPLKPLFHSLQNGNRKLAASAFKYCECTKVLAASLQVGFYDEWILAPSTRHIELRHSQFILALSCK